MHMPLDRISIPVDGSEIVIWLCTTCNLTDRVFYHRTHVFSLLDKPRQRNGLPQFGVFMQPYVVRHQHKQDLVSEAGHTTLSE